MIVPHRSRSSDTPSGAAAGLSSSARRRYRSRTDHVLTTTMSVMQRLLVLVAVVLLGATVAKADNWNFSRSNDVFARQAQINTRGASSAPRRTEPPVIRGQFDADSGRSVPSLVSPPAYSGSSSYSPAAPQSASPSPAYGQSYAPPMLSGDAPVYVPGQGVMDALGQVGNDPALSEPTRFIPLNPILQETQTGRMMFGVGVNSDAGMVGSIVLDEQNFDWTRFPRSWEEIRNATAWRGAGQRFRIEAVPGTEYQRYMVDFQEPYLDILGYQSSLGLSGFYYTRNYLEWDEDRVGGRVAIGYHFSPALMGSLAFRGMKVGVYDPVGPNTPAELTEALGDSALYGFQGKLSHDTRDSQFLATEGHLFQASFEQVIGTWSYPRAEVEMRQYFLLHERPDGSGRHVLSLSGQVGYTGDDTPIYEHYFAGGFSTIRGFDFRGASPRDPLTGVRVGGHFQMLASAEYLFPITADDMLRGVIFCDTGTVERKIDHWQDTYRVAPGFGLRVVIPAMGPAPIALDFAFPVSRTSGDEIENFSFFVGFLR